MTFARNRQPARWQFPGTVGALTLAITVACQARPFVEPPADAEPTEHEPAVPGLTRKPRETSKPPQPQPAADAGWSNDPHARSGSGSFVPPQPERVRIVAIGDYGWAGPAEQQVAELVDSFRPDYVVTTGDNNYPYGEASTIDQNIGQYFSELIHPYKGNYASSATENRFFPTLGNHDWYTQGAAPYLDYFTLPGNERYYDVAWGDVHFFAIDSDPNEPDGITATSTQANWLRQGLAASTQAFNIVAMHHPPFSSGPHGDTAVMQWPYAEWGADLVLAGHDHGYERLEIDGLTYVVSGLGGASIYSYGQGVPGSIVRYSEQYGATLLEADAHELRISFFDVDGRLVDTARILAR
jgi:tartrate-resistant acid phosphatase type 5